MVTKSYSQHCYCLETLKLTAMHLRGDILTTGHGGVKLNTPSVHLTEGQMKRLNTNISLLGYGHKFKDIPLLPGLSGI